MKVSFSPVIGKTKYNNNLSYQNTAFCAIKPTQESTKEPSKEQVVESKLRVILSKMRWIAIAIIPLFFYIKKINVEKVEKVLADEMEKTKKMPKPPVM